MATPAGGETEIKLSLSLALPVYNNGPHPTHYYYDGTDYIYTLLLMPSLHLADLRSN